MAARRRAGSFSPKTSRRLRISKVETLWGTACLLSASSAACDISTRNGYISSARLRIATRWLGLKQRAEYLGPASFEVPVSLESALQHILDSLLRFRPSQRGLKRSDGGEEAVGGRQRDLVDEILRGGNGTLVEGGNSARECVDETIQFGVWKCPIDVAVSFRDIPVEIVRAE